MLPFLYEGQRSFLFGLHIGLLALLIFASGKLSTASSLSFHSPGPVPVYCATLGAILAHRLLFRSLPLSIGVNGPDHALTEALSKSHRTIVDQLTEVAAAVAKPMPYVLCWQERGGRWNGLTEDRSGNRYDIEDDNFLDRLSASNIGGNIVVDCSRGNAVRLTRRDIVRHNVDPQLSARFAKLLGTNTLLSAGYESLELRVLFAMASDRPLSLGTLSHFRGLADAMVDQIETLLLVTDWRRRILREARTLATRDMHDSVLQTLGGLRMRIAALRHAAILADVSELDAIVAAEQSSLRTMLQQSENAPVGAVDLAEHFDRRLRALARQWDVACSFEPPPTVAMVSAETAFECEFLLREAVANAVKHAEARVLAAKLAFDQGWLIITLSSDGIFAGPVVDGAIALVSRSLAQRVERLNGTAYTEPTSRGALLSIRIPMERK
jgi:signal transduction histidine kinase